MKLNPIFPQHVKSSSIGLGASKSVVLLTQLNCQRFQKAEMSIVYLNHDSKPGATWWLTPVIPGGKDQKDGSSKPAWKIVHKTLSRKKKKNSKKKSGGVA
jgi:hypothetical protein